MPGRASDAVHVTFVRPSGASSASAESHAAPSACAAAYARVAAELAERFNRTQCCRTQLDATGSAPDGPPGHVVVSVL